MTLLGCSLTVCSLTQLLWIPLCCAVLSPTAVVLPCSPAHSDPAAPRVLSPHPSLGILLTVRAEPWTGELAPLAKACVFPTALESVPSVTLWPEPCCKSPQDYLIADCSLCAVFFFPSPWIQIGFHGYVLAVVSTNSNLLSFLTWASALSHLCSSAPVVSHSHMQPSVMSHHQVPHASDPITKEWECRAAVWWSVM